MEVVVAVLAGLPMTLMITVAALAIGLIGGLPLLAGSRSQSALVSLPTRVLIDIIRGIPTVVWLFFIFFGLSVGSVKLNSVSAAIIGLGVISSAYVAEIYRGGFQSVPTGQTEASKALGVTRRTALTHVIAPQVARVSLPALTSYTLALVKDSSIASTIGVVEMVFRATAFTRQNPDMPAMMPFLVAAGVYVLISVPMAVLSRKLDSLMGRNL